MIRRVTFRHLALSLIVERDPAEAHRRIVEAYVTAGSEMRASYRLDVGRQTLRRLVERLRAAGYDVRAEVERRRMAAA